jgi:hypothetical protein
MLLQLRLQGLWDWSQSMVRRYGGEAAGTAEDDSSIGYDLFHTMTHANT